MRVLLLGSGGREHALGWAMRAEDPNIDLRFAPGNGGTHRLGRNLPVSLENPSALVSLAEREEVDWTLVGPEAPLVLGVVDAFRARGLAIFGPTQRAAEIEGSKIYAKELFGANGIPTAPFEVFDNPRDARTFLRHSMYPQVIKADGLAAGKGVIIARSLEEAERAVDEILDGERFGRAGARILIEAFLEGEEVSAFALCRGEEFRLLPLSRDHKRAEDGDRGPNTGGMGAIAPHPRSDPALVRTIEEQVFAPTLAAMARDRRPFHGLLYAGLMLVDGRPYVLEFNCRFGDPETEAVVPLLGAGFTEALFAVASGEGPLPEVKPWRPENGEFGYAATVVMASGGYPDAYQTGQRIHGIEAAEALPETFVFHAGTRRDGDRLLSAGGRVLAVTARAGDPATARSRAYDGVSLITFDGCHYRRDIGRV